MLTSRHLGLGAGGWGWGKAGLRKDWAEGRMPRALDACHAHWGPSAHTQELWPGRLRIQCHDLWFKENHQEWQAHEEGQKLLFPLLEIWPIGQTGDAEQEDSNQAPPNGPNSQRCLPSFQGSQRLHSHLFNWFFCRHLGIGTEEESRSLGVCCKMLTIWKDVLGKW